MKKLLRLHRKWLHFKRCGMIAGIITVISFFAVVGTAGALETDSITMAQFVPQALGSIAAFALSALAVNFYTELEERTYARLKRQYNKLQDILDSHRELDYMHVNCEPRLRLVK